MLTDKQKQFANEYFNGKDATNAYCVAYNKENSSVVRSAASRLLKSTEIQKYISELQAENKKIVDLANQKAADVIVEGSIANANERMIYLSKLLRGEITITQVTASGGKLVEVSEVTIFSERIKAIAELNKMVGDYAPTQVRQEVKIEDANKTKIRLKDGTEIEI